MKVGTSDLLVQTLMPIPLKAPTSTDDDGKHGLAVEGGGGGGGGVKRAAEGEPGTPVDPDVNPSGGGGSSRRRRGAVVDYAALNAQLEAAEASLQSKPQGGKND